MQKAIYIIGIIFMILGFVLGMLTPFLRNLVKKTETKVDDIALEVAINVVNFVDGMFNGKSPESKKQRASDLIEMNLAKLGLTVSKDTISSVIEKAVTINAVEKANNSNENLVPVASDTEKK